MARRKPKLTVRYSSSAIHDLGEIWNYNVDRYGLKWADDYLRFLETRILNLETDFALGRPIDSLKELSSVHIYKRSKGSGHVVIFEVLEDLGEVRIHHVFHSRQDWRNKL